MLHKTSSGVHRPYRQFSIVVTAQWKPAVLVFGSHTRPQIRQEVPVLNPLYDQNKGNVDFHGGYINEASASEVWQDRADLSDRLIFASPKDFARRTAVGLICVANLGIKFPAVVDTFDNAVERAYTAWLDRLYVIACDDRIAHETPLQLINDTEKTELSDCHVAVLCKKSVARVGLDRRDSNRHRVRRFRV